MFVHVTPLYDYPQDHTETLTVNTRNIQRVVKYPFTSAAGSIGQIFMLGFDNRIFSLQLNAADMAAIESAIKLDNIVDQASAKPLPKYQPPPAPPESTEAVGQEAARVPKPEGFQGS